MNLYILNINGTEAGPYTEQQLRAMWLTGAITVNTDWRLFPDGEWRSGTELTERMEPVLVKPTGSKVPMILQGVSLLIILAGFAMLSWEQFPKHKEIPSLPQWEYIEVESDSEDANVEAPRRGDFSMPDMMRPDSALDNMKSWELCGTFTRTYIPLIKGDDGKPLEGLLPKTSTFFIFKRQIQ